MNADLDRMQARIIDEALEAARARHERQALAGRIKSLCDDAAEERRAALRRLLVKAA
jgi:hypothetical protein